MRAVTYLDRRAAVWREGVATVVDGRVQISADAPDAGMPRLDGVVTGGFTDAHVHLQLVDSAALAESTLGMVIDLGGNPQVLAAVARAAAVAPVAAVAAHNSGVLTQTRPDTADSAPFHEKAPELCTGSGVKIVFAGAFLTPPGGYPSDRTWAPEGSVREIADADAAAAAIAEMKAAGATCIKLASNSVAGPVFSDEMFTTIVELASTQNLSVMTHAEGPGEAQRASLLRARGLAHAPFTERLTDTELRRMHGNVAWVSTLAIHDGEAYDIAIDNVRRFHALGGNILYGTDMGNGPAPVGINPQEVAALREAGIDGADLLQSLAPVDPLNPASRLNFIPGASPETADPLRARPLAPADLED
ncbi:hypothetical protein [Microbacterium sp.]|uniref:hypothetical protein n=1 Tax=Microbacterium sp. TaxID=51671 RepID=UPI003F9A5103